MKFWLWQILVALDQLGNAMLGGWADETLSARAYRADRDGKVLGRIFRPMFDWVFERLADEQDHCARAHASEVGLSHLPPAYRPNNS